MTRQLKSINLETIFNWIFQLIILLGCIFVFITYSEVLKIKSKLDNKN